MAVKNKVRNTGGSKELPSWFNEVAGIGMIGAGLLLLLALISFDYGDVPEALYGPKNDAAREATNMIGVLGAIIAWLFLLILGAASFLVAIGLIWLGIAYAFMEAKLTKRTWIGFVCFVVIGACLVNVIGIFSGWSENIGLGEKSPGGNIGVYLGSGVFESLLNKPGAVLVLTVGYLVGMIMLTSKNE